MKKSAVVVLIGSSLAACSPEGASNEGNEPVIRGLKTVIVKEQEETTLRRFPSVLQPAEITTLSFEAPGKLGPVELKVGQTVGQGEVLVMLDTTSLEIQVESAKAALIQAQSSADNAAATLKRQEELLEKKVTTRSKVDDARTTMETTAAQAKQAQKQLENAEENLANAALVSPFGGVINSVEVDSFANVNAGTPVATLYSTDGFEASFSANYETVQRLAVGKPVTIRLADSPDTELDAIVSELGSRADTVSSFPVIVALNENRPELKAGMAVEIVIELPVPRGVGFLLPLSVLPLKGNIDPGSSPEEPGKTHVYVFNPDTQTVKQQEVLIGGVRENQLIVVDGINAGDRIASAGVSFLRDGQKVNLLSDSQ